MEFIDKLLVRYYNRRARAALLDFASIHMHDLSIGEISKIMEVVAIVREYSKVDK